MWLLWALNITDIVGQRSSDPLFYKVTCYIKWVTTSWTDGIFKHDRYFPSKKNIYSQTPKKYGGHFTKLFSTFCQNLWIMRNKYRHLINVYKKKYDKSLFSPSLFFLLPSSNSIFRGLIWKNINFNFKVRLFSSSSPAVL